MASAVRNTRPRNRRSQITTAASELFHRRGYPRVGMSDIAEAVGVGPSALYRHFASKQLLLTEVVVEELRPFREVLRGVGTEDLDIVVAELATAALDHRRLGVLWQREARHLPGDERAGLKEELRSVAGGLAELARVRRPELADEDARFRGWCLFSVLTSPSYHQVELPRAEFERLLRTMVGVIVDQPPMVLAPRPEVEVRSPLLDERASRRAVLLSVATRLFADSGFTAVTTEDIGAAAGIAGPSVYSHFASKQEILGAVIARGCAWLEMELERTLSATSDAEDALRRLLHSYITFAYDHGQFIDILVSEVGHLPSGERHRARQTQHDYVAEWVALLRRVRPELDRLPARVLVQAALTAANDMARTGTVRDVAAVSRLAAALMFDAPAYQSFT
ncbi:TetR/AcrR family transcriptional regulator [Saccharopolyspora taberi]|uniref:TetR/AcrR family transcriptional regulator n=1 Tax=Saccharopolyspora taberi TaxID=60895 RepID=A0ABN3VGR2_9PSEU